MKTNGIKIAFYLMLSYIFFSESLSGQNLKVRSVEFPDSVNIGESAILKGYVVNSTNEIFNKQLRLNVDVEDKTPPNIMLDNEVDRIIVLNEVNIAPNDSLYFEQRIAIRSNSFSRGTVDLILIWPQMSDNTPSNVARKADVKLTYVKDKFAVTAPSEEFDFLPEDVLDFIYENYPSSKIEGVDINDCDFEIKLSSNEKIEFPIYDCTNDDDDDDGFYTEIVTNHNYHDDDDDNGYEYLDNDDDFYSFEDKNYNDDDDDNSEEDEDNDDGYDDDDDNYNDDDDDNISDDDGGGNKEGLITSNDELNNNNNFITENVRELNTKYIASIGKVKNDNTNYFTIEKEADQLMVKASAGFALNTVTVFSLDGKMLLQKNSSTTNLILKLNEIAHKSALIMIQVLGKNIESNSTIQQSQKVFVSTY